MTTWPVRGPRKQYILNVIDPVIRAKIETLAEKARQAYPADFETYLEQTAPLLQQLRQTVSNSDYVIGTVAFSFLTYATGGSDRFNWPDDDANHPATRR